jgi:hypothetical protein
MVFASQLPLLFCGGFFAFHRYLDVGGDFAVQLDWDQEFAEGLQRFVQMHLAAVDVEALGLESVGDVGRRDRAEEVIVLTDLALEYEGHVVELCDQLLGFALLFR